MRITVNLSSYYHWEKVPEGTPVTEEDIKLNRVRPAANGGYNMRVTRKMVTHTSICISEDLICRRIIHEFMPQNGNKSITRKEAVGEILAHQIMPHHAHPKHMTSFVIDVDDGPEESLLRAMIDPYTEALHASGELLIDPSDVEAMVARYMESASVEEHTDHLHKRFGVKRVATETGVKS